MISLWFLIIWKKAWFYSKKNCAFKSAILCFSQSIKGSTIPHNLYTLLTGLITWDCNGWPWVKPSFRSSDKRAELPADLKHSIQSWNNADFALFDRVNKTFWSRVINFGLDRMEKEKKLLNDQIDIWLDYCVANISTITQNDLRQKWKKKIKSDPRMLNTTIQDSFKYLQFGSQMMQPRMIPNETVKAI